MKETFSQSKQFSKYDVKKLWFKFAQAVISTVVAVFISFIPDIQELLLNFVESKESLQLFVAPIAMIINWLSEVLRTYLKDYTNE